MAKAEQKSKAPAPMVVDHADFSDEQIETGTEFGAVQIHNSVIAAIARLAALRVPGVAEMSGGLVDGRASVIGKKSNDRGIRVEVADEGVKIEMNVIMEYGVRIPHVAWQVQNEVRQAVEQMTGKGVKSVQVIVQGVKMPQEARAPATSRTKESAT